MTIVRRLIYALLLLALVWAGVRFVRGNEGTMQIDLLLGEPVSLAIWQALLVAFAAGAALTVVISLLEVARYSLLARRYRKAAARLEGEVHQLRNLPLDSEGAPPADVEAGLPTPSEGTASGRG